MTSQSRSDSSSETFLNPSTSSRQCHPRAPPPSTPPKRSYGSFESFNAQSAFLTPGQPGCAQTTTASSTMNALLNVAGQSSSAPFMSSRSGNAPLPWTTGDEPDFGTVESARASASGAVDSWPADTLGHMSTRRSSTAGASSPSSFLPPSGPSNALNGGSGVGVNPPSVGKSLARRWTPSQEHLVFRTPRGTVRSTLEGTLVPREPQGQRGSHHHGHRTSILSVFSDAFGVGTPAPPHHDSDFLYDEEDLQEAENSMADDSDPSSGHRSLGARGEEVVGEDSRFWGGRSRSRRSRSPATSREASGHGRAVPGASPDVPQQKQYGVLKAEVIVRSLRANPGWGVGVVYVGIYLLSVVTSVEANALPVVEPFFLSLFGAHGLISSVGIVTNIAYAVGKPPMAKIMDVFGRSEGVAVAAAFVFLGAVLTSSSNTVAQYAIARIAAALGSQGLQLAQQIIVADTSSLSSRGLLTSTISSPWIVTTWIGPWVGDWFKRRGEAGYRSIYAVFGVLVPLVAIYLAASLLKEWRMIRKGGGFMAVSTVESPLPGYSAPGSSFDAEVGHGVAGTSGNYPTPGDRLGNGRGRRKSTVSHMPTSSRPLEPHKARADTCSTISQDQVPHGSRRLSFSGLTQVVAADAFDWKSRSARSLGRETWTQLDVLGIGLLTMGCSMVLLPLTLATRRPQSWADPKLYIVLLSGVVILVVFALYEARVSKNPILPARLMKERTIVMGSSLCFWHFVCQFVYESYFTSFLQVARYASSRDAQYIQETYIFSACVSSILAGLLIKWSRRYKIWMIFGILLHAVGALMMVRFRRLENPTWELVLTQVIAGAGGGFTTLGAQLGVQSVVSHQDVGIATACFLTITQCGGAVGASIAGAVWTTLLPNRLRSYLPASEHDQVPKIVNDLNAALSYARGTNERGAINDAYVDVQRLLNYLSLFALAPTLLSALHMKNIDLSAQYPELAEGVMVLGRADPLDEEIESETSSLLDREHR